MPKTAEQITQAAHSRVDEANCGQQMPVAVITCDVVRDAVENLSEQFSPQRHVAANSVLHPLVAQPTDCTLYDVDAEAGDPARDHQLMHIIDGVINDHAVNTAHHWNTIVSSPHQRAALIATPGRESNEVDGLL